MNELKTNKNVWPNIIGLIALTLALHGCSRMGQDLADLSTSELVLLVQEDHWFYHKNHRGDWEGFNYELITNLEKQYNTKFTVKLYASEEELFDAFETGAGDIMCPALSLNCEAWKKSNKLNPELPAPTFLMELTKKSYPTVRFKVSDEEDFIWVVREEKQVISKVLSAWEKKSKAQLFLANLYEKYFAHLGLLNKFELLVLKTRYERDLPKFRSHFEEAGQIHSIDPLFIAAMAYQESHWNPEAISYTGVKGLMMLTQSTAESLGIQDRTDPRESILGGTKYLFQIKNRLEGEIGNPDKNYYALAAYNVGLGHVRDAQELVKKLGQDPLLWSNLRDALPLLAHPAYYKDLKHGKARGHEPVRYVDSIRNYYSLILKLEKENEKRQENLEEG